MDVDAFPRLYHQPFTTTDLGAAFKQAMRRLTSTVSLITTSMEGRRVGMAATAVQSVTADPATLLVCINRSASISQPLHQRGRFAVNILHVSHVHLVPLFSGKLKDEARFAYGDWETVDSVPVLSDAQAVLVCDVQSAATVGSHDVIFGEVVSIRIRQDIAPLLYEDGGFARSKAIPVPG
ncbi:MAG: flavin reductase family protein [Rhizobiaceae bacterium]|nr:flavin reductase family protein [Rhizobiaceae bacterium]